MRFFKGLVGLIMAIILIGSAGIFAGSIALEKAVSEEAIEKAIEETDAVDRIADSIVRQSSTDVSRSYSTSLKKVMKSQAMTDFMTRRISESMKAKLEGEELMELDRAEFKKALLDGFEECKGSDDFTLGVYETGVFNGALEKAIDNLAKSTDYVLERMELTTFLDEKTNEVLGYSKQLATDEIRYGSLGISVIMFLMLLLLFWRTKGGILWTAFSLLILAGFFWLLSYMVQATMGVSGDYAGLSTRLLYIMAGYGLESTAIPLGVIGVGMMAIVYPLFRIIFRKRY